MEPSMSMILRGVAVLLFFSWTLSGPTALCKPAETPRHQKKQIQESLRPSDTPGLVLGEFTLPSKAVVDGDTLKVSELKNSLRLLHIDTEETFKTKGDRRLFSEGWESYLKAKRGDSPRPVKMATPLGEDGKAFAEKFFEGVERVRLERDHPREIRDRYDRYLVYVFAFKNGGWINYNVECVRAGMSPYFTKYGYSRRFHDSFVEAQKQAQKTAIGIWDESKQHYPDYIQRMEWWNARADFLAKFEADSKDREDTIDLNHWDAFLRLGQSIGKEVVILGSVEEILIGVQAPTRVTLSRQKGARLQLVFFDKAVFESSHILRFLGEYVRATGTVTRYPAQAKDQGVLQIVVRAPNQVIGSELVPDFSGLRQTPKEDDPD
jgi:endonuclease YncB( thermonuclease family)